MEEYKDITNLDLNVKTLGEIKYTSLMKLSKHYGDKVVNYVDDSERISLFNTKNAILDWTKNGKDLPSFEKSGPREKLFFEPGKTVSAIVTCGGLCPGLNSVIRGIVLTNYYKYNNKITYGIRFGYSGFIDDYGYSPIELTPKYVKNIHNMGGTVLGSSRGPQDISKIVDKLVELKVNILYTIGGDGTLRGSLAIYEEITKRKLNIAVIGVPKTIDNDIYTIDKSFGSETAFSEACKSIKNAHTEATSAYNGIGLVKVMGRNSGFIAAYATLATNDVNFTLIPEVDFDLDGENGLLLTLEKRLEQSKHAVILVSEGAGQKFFEEATAKYDASGNKKLNNIGLFLKSKITTYLKSKNIKHTVKYIDPSYNIRSIPPTPNDSVFCLQLAQNAVHAGMSGKTGMVVGYFNAEFVNIPIEVVISKRKIVDPESELWLSVLETTGQPVKMLSD